MKIIDVVLTKSFTGFYFDDQKAIRAGNVVKDGFLLGGQPLLEGFTSIRVAGEAISIQLILENGMVATGDCAAVQYSGAGGRDPLFLADEFIPFIEQHIKPLLIGEDVVDFKELSIKYDNLLIEGKKLHTAIRYGITQALLSAAAIAKHTSIVDIIQEEYNLDKNTLKRALVFTQSGDDRYANVDKMILKQVDALPHALINNVEEKLGKQGEILLDYVIWLRNRIIEKRKDESYNPIIHLDVYGTVGLAFNFDVDLMTNYLRALSEAVSPFKLRIEGPVDAPTQKETMLISKALRQRLDDLNLPVEIVIDEWCNNLDDVKYFADNKAGHIIQIKTPDLGGVNNIVDAILYCKEKNIGAYVGGTCNETNISAAITTQIAVACGADLLLAKPGMGVDEGFMIVKSEMERAIALFNAKHKLNK